MCVCYKQYMVRPWSMERSGIPWNIWHRLRCSLHQTLRSGQACAMRTGVPHWPYWKKPSNGTSVSKNGTKIIIRSEQSTSACRNLTWNILHWPRASRRTMAATSWHSDRWGENLGWNPTSKSSFIKTCAGQRAPHNAWPSTEHAARQQWRPVSQPSHLIRQYKSHLGKERNYKKFTSEKAQFPVNSKLTCVLDTLACKESGSSIWKLKILVQSLIIS